MPRGGTEALSQAMRDAEHLGVGYIRIRPDGVFFPDRLPVLVFVAEAIDPRRVTLSATHIQASVHDGLPDPFVTMKRLQAERPRAEFDYPWERPEPDANTSSVGKVVASAIWYIGVGEAQQRQDAFMASWNAHQAAEQAERARPRFEGVWPIPTFQPR